MIDLQQKIQEHFEQTEIKEKFDDLVNQMFKEARLRAEFLRIFDLIKQGEFDILDLDRYLVEDWGLDQDEVFAFNDELFHETYIDIYFELQDLYNEKQGLTEPGERLSKFNEEDQEVEYSKKEIQEDQLEKKLIEVYQDFLRSSVWQNILSAEEILQKNYNEVGEKELESLKNDFYVAVNSGDKIQVGAILKFLAEKELLRKGFEEDARYIEFWGGYLNRHGRDKEGEEFIKDPAHKKFLVEFIKFVLEKRVKFTRDEAVMLGCVLSSICVDKEKEYSEMAYGDENKSMFVWQID